MAAALSIEDLGDLSARAGREDQEDQEDVDSLPSTSTSTSTSTSNNDVYSDDSGSDEAQVEWERSLEQLQLLLTMMIIPFTGKYLGRKFAYWSKSHFMLRP